MRMSTYVLQNLDLVPYLRNRCSGQSWQPDFRRRSQGHLFEAIRFGHARDSFGSRATRRRALGVRSRVGDAFGSGSSHRSHGSGTRHAPLRHFLMRKSGRQSTAHGEEEETSIMHIYQMNACMHEEETSMHISNECMHA